MNGSDVFDDGGSDQLSENVLDDGSDRFPDKQRRLRGKQTENRICHIDFLQNYIDKHASLCDLSMEDLWCQGKAEIEAKTSGGQVKSLQFFEWTALIDRTALRYMMSSSPSKNISSNQLAMRS